MRVVLVLTLSLVGFVLPTVASGWDWADGERDHRGNNKPNTPPVRVDIGGAGDDDLKLPRADAGRRNSDLVRPSSLLISVCQLSWWQQRTTWM